MLFGWFSAMEILLLQLQQQSTLHPPSNTTRLESLAFNRVEPAEN